MLNGMTFCGWLLVSRRVTQEMEFRTVASPDGVAGPEVVLHPRRVQFYEGPETMKSVRLQLLVTLLATVMVAGVFAIRGLPPTKPIWRAIVDGDIGEVRRSLNWGNTKCLGEETPLDWAAGEGRMDMVRLIIAKGVDVNAQNQGGGTALDMAAFGGHNDVALLLIASGATVVHKSTFGLTPLHYAVASGKKDCVKLFIAAGAEVNVKDEDGWSPLHLAAWHGYEDVGELLIDKGANVNGKDGKGATPLAVAIERGHEGFARMLRRHGARE